MILGILQGAALLLALCWLYSVNQRAWGERRKAAQLSAGLLFGGVCIIGMLNPMLQVDGIILDARSALLSMAALFGGPLVVGVAGVLAGAFRLSLGGGGPFAGLSNIVLPILFGLAYRRALLRGKVAVGPRQLLIFALGLHLLLALLLYQVNVLADRQLLWQVIAALLIALPLITLFLGMQFMDVQRRQQTELRLRHNEARLRAISGALPDLLLVLDEDGRYLEVIANDEALLFAPSEQLLGHTVREVLSTSEAEFFLGMIRQSLASEQTQVIEYRIHTKGGSRVFEGHVQRLETPLTEKRAVLLLARDISERVKAQQEQRIAAIAFETQQGIVITDAQSRILRVNKAFTGITGYSADEVIGQHTRMLGSGKHGSDFYQSMWQRLSQDGAWEGEILNRRKNGEIFPEWLTISTVSDAQGMVSHYVATLADISERKAAEDQIRHLAFFDALTTLPNRRLLQDRLQQALIASARSGRFAALMFLDLDNFKNINDLHGHESGDELLRQAAGRITQAVRATDTVARLGGDEFVVVLEELESYSAEAASQAEHVGMKILAALSQPYLIAGTLQRSSASIGVVLFNDNLSGVEELMKRADLSMYQAKNAGKNALRFFDPQMQESVSARLRLEEEIRRGLAGGQFMAFLQPLFDADKGLIGAEVLVRWQHPQRGLLAPAHFIDVAEQLGVIEDLDFQMLQQALAVLQRWATQAHTSALHLAVNLSARLLYQQGFVDRLLLLLDQSAVEPRLLKLELTETLLLDDMPAAIERMNLLKARGIRFSIDDFGTGYSSMAYLQKLPLDQLKIDRSFVAALPEDTGSLAIIRAIHALALSLDLEVIAEGVETDEQHALLLANGCQRFQGYLFGRPQSLADFEQLLVEPLK